MSRFRKFVDFRGRSLGGRLAVVLVLAAVVAAGTAFAEISAPTPEERQITRIVSLLMERAHLTGHQIDNEIASRTMKMFLGNIDPMKLYFYQSDIDEFMAKEDQIDDMVKNGDTTLAWDIYKRYLERLDERIAMVNRLLDEPRDFTLNEEMTVDRDLRKFAANAAESEELWRKRIKYDILIEQTDEVSEEEAVQNLRKRYLSLGKRMHQTDDDELLEIYLTALTMSFDPHSSYMSKSTLENFEISMRLELDGIGASLQFEDGYTVVKRIIPGGAADKDGRLKLEDRVVGVAEGKDGEMVDVVDMKLNDVVQLIRGKRETIVRLEVLPFGQTEPQEYEITRARIELVDEEARSEIFDDVVGSDGATYKIGVIDLPSFYMDMDGAQLNPDNYKSTTRDVRRLLDEFKAAEVDAVVLDLRYNGGGSLTEAISLTGLFIDRGPVVQVKGPDGRVQPYDDRDPGMAWDGPLVVMISKFSASASEIFAGAIQDYHRGLIVGDRLTLGKGTVQQLFDLGERLFGPNAPSLGALKLTIQQFYRPGGDSTQNRGVVSDIELPSLTTQYDVGESDQDYALAFDKVDEAPHDQFQLVNPNIVAELRGKSAARVDSSEDFIKVRNDIEKFIEQKEADARSLNREVFLAERAELNADQEQKERLEAISNPDSDKVVDRDYYFNETLAITGDYVNLLRSNRVAFTPLRPQTQP